MYTLACAEAFQLNRPKFRGCSARASCLQSNACITLLLSVGGANFPLYLVVGLVATRR